ncbi:hypothetical protein CSAL01_13236, partial [Colletotrichum salicis]
LESVEKARNRRSKTRVWNGHCFVALPPVVLRPSPQPSQARLVRFGAYLALNEVSTEAEGTRGDGADRRGGGGATRTRDEEAASGQWTHTPYASMDKAHAHTHVEDQQPPSSPPRPLSARPPPDPCRKVGVRYGTASRSGVAAAAAACSLSSVLCLLLCPTRCLSTLQEKHPSAPWALVPCPLWGFTIWRRLIRVVHRVPSANSKQATAVEPMCPRPRSLDSHDTKTTRFIT